MVRPGIGSIALLVAAFVGLTPGFAALQPRHAEPHRITLTIDIVPSKSTYSRATWGKVRFKKGTCAAASCPYRVYAGVTFRFTESATEPREHPFEHWVLPSGKQARGQSVKIKMTADGALIADFKK